MSVVIPSSVLTIGADAFYECASLTSVTIGDGVTSIGNDAFANCLALTDVTLGGSVSSIGNDAFYSVGMSSIDLPSGLLSIGDGAFSYSALSSIVLPDSVTHLGDYAFHRCESLASVSLGAGIEVLDWYVFRGCTSLVSVQMSAGLDSLETGVFMDCTALTHVYFPGVPPTDVANGSFDSTPATFYYLPKNASEWPGVLHGRPTAPWLPRITGATRDTGTGRFHCTTFWGAGERVRIEFATSLVNPDWAPLLNVDIPASGMLEVIDPNSASADRRFYRVRP